MFRQDGSCPALLEDLCPGFPYGAVTRYGPPFQTLPVPKTKATGLVRVRSPLLAESRLMSFPPATEMFQFAGFASRPYGFRSRIPLAGGLPHSEIPGSTIARISPGLFAACHVLHRLSVPRHPPDALTLRLSATPNGKDHRCQQTPHNRRAQGQDPSERGKLASQKTLARTADTASHEDTSPDTARNARLAACGHSRAPPRSHHKLSLHPSISTPASVAPGRRLSASSPNVVGARPVRLARNARVHADGGGDRDRTDDLLLAKQVLSQLSYTPVLQKTRTIRRLRHAQQRSDHLIACCLIPGTGGGPGRI